MRTIHEKPSYWHLMTQSEKRAAIARLVESGLSHRSIGSLIGLDVFEIRQILAAPKENETA
jgi:hypothetical protein